MKILKSIGIFLLIFIVATLIYFILPYSPLKSEIKNDLNSLLELEDSNNEILTDEDVKDLPNPIKKYIENSGFIGKEKYTNVNLYFKDAKLIQDPEKPPLKVNFNQYNYSNNPVRLALVDSKFFGIPFEGYDYLYGEKAGMKGVLAKNITLFNETGIEMYKGALVTYLSESLLLPTSALNKYITFEEIDKYRVKAKITYNGISVEGTFRFNEKYEIEEFTTNDRYISLGNGEFKNIPWTEKFLEYDTTKDGIKYLKHGQAIWNYPEGDLISFDGIVDRVEFK